MSVEIRVQVHYSDLTDLNLLDVAVIVSSCHTKVVTLAFVLDLKALETDSLRPAALCVTIGYIQLTTLYLHSKYELILILLWVFDNAAIDSWLELPGKPGETDFLVALILHRDNFDGIRFFEHEDA